MKFGPVIPDLDPVNQCFNISTSETGIVEIGCYRVIYGYRVQAWYREKRDTYVDLSWCCGDQWKNVEIAYSMLTWLLGPVPEKRASCLTCLPPFSDIKPYYNDPGFMMKLHEASKQCQGPMPFITLPPATTAGPGRAGHTRSHPIP